MMRAPCWRLILGAAVAVFALGAESVQAQADLSACNNIYVKAEAECTVIPPSANCEAQCTPITIEAACSARLQAMCDARCTADFDVGCTASCSASCEADCKVDPGEFDCQAYCQADCSGSCQGECAAGEGGAHCRAACQATCSADCNAECKITPPSVDCKAKCNASCEGSCHAKANIDCQAKCQADFYASCEADIRGGCMVDCMTQEGALFCDGSYVDTGNNLQMCIDALEAALDVEYSGTAKGDCENGRCSGSAEGSVSCNSMPGGSGSSLFALALGCIAYIARRRRKL